MKLTKDITVQKIITHAAPGCIVNEGLREALLLALEEMKIVTFTHNAKTFNINPDDILDNIPFEEKC